MDPSFSNIKQTTSDAEDYDEDDGPTYRAMAIGSAEEVVTSPTFKSISFGMSNLHLHDNPYRQGKPVLEPSILEVGKPPKTRATITPTGADLTPESDLVARSNWIPPSGGWNLPSVPAYYPMEKTYEHVPATQSSPTKIAALISDACQKMSIYALYNSEKGVAHLTSADFVEFYVFMYKTSGGTDSRGDGVIVEVQRRKGCTMSFHRYARKILSAAVGEVDIDFEEVNGPSSSNLNLLTEKLIQEGFQSCLKTERKHTVEAIEIAGNLLGKDRLDANVLGMESLCLLTDPTKTGTLTSTLVSRVILCGTMRPQTGVSPEEEGISEETDLEEEAFLIKSLDIRGRIMSLIRYKKLSPIDDEDSDEELVSHREKYGDVDNHMHNLALATLSNALKNIAKDGSLGETCSQQPWLKGSELVSTLIDVLKQAERRPHDAVLSARCLGSLVQASKEATDRAMKMDALAVVETAKHVGNLRHANLARETGGLHKKLSSIGAVNA
jgi:hypothetical protein